MKYQDVISYMNKRWRKGTHLGLFRIKTLLAELGHPEERLKFIHVAGTNGKGSTASYIAAILAQSGMRVGLYTSPFLERFTDRIRILAGPDAVKQRASDSRTGEISEAEVAACFTQVMEATDRMSARALEEPSEFEVLTAAALFYFAEKNCDLVVLETGLGGRLDATNAIPAPLVAVITALGYDHCEFLGDTMAEIAAEKAAIIKEGSLAAVLYDPDYASATPEDAAAILSVVRARCQACGVPLLLVRENEVRLVEHSIKGIRFYLEGLEPLFTLGLPGDFQKLNAACALRAVLAIRPELRDSAVLADALASAVWPGRLECLRDDPLFLIDGAHNPQAAWALSRTIRSNLAERKLVLLIGVLADKDYPTIFRMIWEALARQILAIVCTQAGSSRDLPSDKLAALMQTICSEDSRVGDPLSEDFCADAPCTVESRSSTNPAIITEPDIRSALRQSLALAAENGAVLLSFGSLYLVTEVKRHDQEIRKIEEINHAIH